MSTKDKPDATPGVEAIPLLYVGGAVGLQLLSSGLVLTRSELWARIGLLLCSIVAFVIIGKYAKQFLDAGQVESQEFPGPQALPAFGIFMSLMAFLASSQALTRV